MRKATRYLALATILAAGLAVAPALMAHDRDDAPGAMMGQGGTMGMMDMMARMGRMMDHCGQMMGDMPSDRDAVRPNEQWRRDAPAAPQTKR